MQKIRIFTSFIVISLLSTSLVFADGNDIESKELVAKNKRKVENAGTKDWKTLAECANSLVEKRIANDEVASWIEKSILIKSTVYNQVIKGDYLVLTGDLNAAKETYVEAILLAQKESRFDKIPSIQWKILITMGIENYNSFHAANK